MRHIYIAILAFTAMTFTACNKDFLERDPYAAINQNTFFTKAEHANLAAMAAYSKLQKLNLHWADAQLELGMTGDFTSAGFKDAQAFYVGSFNANETNIVKGIWQRAYQGIALCNANITGIKSMQKSIISDDDRDKYLAELYFIRAFWYYRLVQFYGDVPLRTETVSNPSDKSQVEMAASPKSKIMTDLVIPDFQFASKHLPANWGSAMHNRATSGAAYAYLLDAYLYQKDYDNAILAGKAVEGLGYKLLENPGDVLRVNQEGSSEIIFSVGFGAGAQTYREFYFGTLEDLGVDGRIMRGDTYSGDYFYPSKEFVNFFTAIDGQKIAQSPLYKSEQPWKNRDPRFDATFFTEQDEIQTTTGKKLMWSKNWLVNKATGFDIQKRGVWYGDNNWNFQADIHLMRLPRVYLLLAEAYANKNDFANAEKYIEKVRERARNFALNNADKYVPNGMSANQVLPKFNISSLKDAMDAINYESRVEFFTEDAIRYFDLKRWNKLQEEWPRVGGFTWDDKLYNLPIPAEELNTNHSLKQNHPGWGE